MRSAPPRKKSEKAGTWLSALLTDTRHADQDLAQLLAHVAVGVTQIDPDTRKDLRVV